MPLEVWNSLNPGDSGREALELRQEALTARLSEAFDEALEMLPESPLRTRVYNARKVFFQRRKLPTPAEQTVFGESEALQELNEIIQLYNKLREEQEGLGMEWDKALLRQFEALQHIARREDFQRMLLFASHELLRAFPAFLSVKPEDFGKKERQIALSVLQYLSRAVHKTSPLGRFTTVQACTFDTFERALEFPEIEKTLVAPNVSLLPLFYEVLVQEQAFYAALDLRLNPGLKQPNDGHLEWIYFDGEQEAFQEAAADALMQWVTDFFREKEAWQRPFLELLSELSVQTDGGETQLKNFIFRLVDIGLLEWVWPEMGNSGSWCGNLLQFLARLPQSDLLTETAFLLQWLRTAARSLPFQSREAVMSTQEEALERCRAFVEAHGVTFPSIPVEQIFFEDVMRDAPAALSLAEIQRFATHLRTLWKQQAEFRLPVFRQKLWRYTQEAVLPEGAPFLNFCRDFLEKYPQIEVSKQLAVEPQTDEYRGQKLGVMMQCFVENGEYKAVINGIYPGSGKMLARWVPFFTADMAAQFRDFSRGDSGALEVDFPWQSWTNANFQPETPKTALLIPGGRLPISKGKRKILLSDLVVKPGAGGMPMLTYARTGEQVLISDLGLEAPEGRPPAMQVLWHLGVPWVSLGALIPESGGWELRNGVQYRKRMEYESLVLARESWVLEQEQYLKLFEGSTPSERAASAGRKLSRWGIPSRFFAQFTGKRDKPQFFDVNSPVSVVLLEKKLRNATERFWISEMLPLPEQWLEARGTEINVLI